MIQARAILAEQFGKITLAPVNDNGHLTYAAKGKVDLFAGSRVECAEGTAALAYSSTYGNGSPANLALGGRWNYHY